MIVVLLVSYTVVSTIPLPYLVKLAPDLPEDERAKVAAIVNIGVACAVFKLKHSITPNFWTNINDPDMGIPGLIEYSNLNPRRPRAISSRLPPESGSGAIVGLRLRQRLNFPDSRSGWRKKLTSQKSPSRGRRGV